MFTFYKTKTFQYKKKFKLNNVCADWETRQGVYNMQTTFARLSIAAMHFSVRLSLPTTSYKLLSVNN